MAKPEDFTPEFFEENNIEAIELALDTLHCNARCEFCYLPPALRAVGGDPMRPLHQDQQAMDLMGAFVVGYVNSRVNRGLPVRRIEFLGGEVTVYPHNLEMLRSWVKKAPQASFEFVTNGVLFHKHWGDFALQTNSRVQFSLNAFDEESHRDRMKVGPTFKTVVENIKYFSTQTKTEVTVSFVMSPKTVRQHYYSKIALFLREEFLDKGLVNFDFNFPINLNPQTLSEESTFGPESFQRDDALLEDFINNEIPVLVRCGVVAESWLHRVLVGLQATPEEIQKVFESWDIPSLAEKLQLFTKQGIQTAKFYRDSLKGMLSQILDVE